MSVTVPTIDAVLDYVPYSVRLAAKRAAQLEAAAAENGIDRRVHQRIRAADLKWLRGSRVKNGPEVTLVDFSVGGVLLDSDVRLKPGAVITLEIVGAGTVEVRSEVLRCQIAALRDAAAVYRGALAFKSPFDLRSLLALADHQRHGERTCARTAQPAESGVLRQGFRREPRSRHAVWHQ